MPNVAAITKNSFSTQQKTDCACSFKDLKFPTCSKSSDFSNAVPKRPTFDIPKRRRPRVKLHVARNHGTISITLRRGLFKAANAGA